MDSKQTKPNVYCIFTKAKDEPNTQIEKAFDDNDIELWKLASCYV